MNGASLSNSRPHLLDVTRLIWRRWAGRLPTGIDRVCLAYLREYRSRSQAVVQARGFRRILTESASDKLFDMLSVPGPGLRTELIKVLGGGRLRSFRDLPGRQRLYLNVGHTALQEPSFLAWTRASQVRPVYMVHDLIPITNPEFCRAGEADKHELRVRNVLASAVGVIGNSQATLDSLETFAARETLDTPSTIAAPLGTDLRLNPHGRIARQSRPTFVVLGTIEARKNHLMLLEMWRGMVARLGADTPRLLIIGQRGWECEQVFEILDHDEILRGAVIEVGRCTDPELTAHLKNARALLFPSLVEGYGLPLIEALHAGVPVIASDLPVFREIGQNIPDFLDPMDPAAWERQILSYASDESASRAAQLERLEGYRAPSWADHFAGVNAWLETL